MKGPESCAVARATRRREIDGAAQARDLRRQKEMHEQHDPQHHQREQQRKSLRLHAEQQPKEQHAAQYDLRALPSDEVRTVLLGDQMPQKNARWIVSTELLDSFRGLL